MKTIIVSLLICFLFAFAAAESLSTHAEYNIELDVFSASNEYYLAIAVNNAGVGTQSVQIQQAQSSTWQPLTYQDWGYYTISSKDALKFPVSVRLTSVNGAKVTIDNAISSASVGAVDTGVTYSGSTAEPKSVRGHNNKATAAPTAAPHHKSATSAPTAAPHKSATTAPTTAHKSATTAPTTPAHKAATTAPKVATAAPNKAATTAPSSGCSAGLKLLVPLYVDPDSSWDTVASGAASVPTVAIINPDSGPGSGPDSSYTTYMAKLHAAGVEMIGYVHTSYGTRDITTVKAEIDTWATEFENVVGIFLDEAGDTASVLPYYQELYTYIMSMPGWKYDVINPGTVPTSGYATGAATQIVTYEDTASGFASSANPSFASCSTKNEYAMIAYGGSSSAMESSISAARSKGYYGWVYVTDGAAGGSTYNSLASYYSTMVSYVASSN